jgi:hypothetical protein
MGAGGIVTVSPEQLLAWNPEIVITIESDFFNGARSDDVWWPLCCAHRAVSLARFPAVG